MLQAARKDDDEQLNSTDALAERLMAVRRATTDLVQPLSAEDMAVRASDATTPVKWHLGHTTWFFETFVLLPYAQGYKPFDERFGQIFNSYYQSIGPRLTRAARGALSRPSVNCIFAYRAQVDEAIERLLGRATTDLNAISALVEIGIQHEQQHQELLLADVLALFAANPLRPAYLEGEPPQKTAQSAPLAWLDFEGGCTRIGHSGCGHAWDNEMPRHPVLLHDYRLASRLVTNGEWLAFIEDGGYREPMLWLDDGWSQVQREGWRAPLYWFEDGGEFQMTLHGARKPDPAAPVCHVSYYEADAFARWHGSRLPTEAEWEHAAALTGASASRAMRAFTTRPAAADGQHQLFGEAWQWTASAYLAYPGYRPPAGGLAEYNGKFMVGQHVLRGSSFATPAGHARITYRNFFYPDQRRQFVGVRLAADVSP